MIVSNRICTYSTSLFVIYKNFEVNNCLQYIEPIMGHTISDPHDAGQILCDRTETVICVLVLTKHG